MSDDREIDTKLLFNQRMTARLLGITPRGFADWNVKPYERKGNQVFYSWPYVREERDRRYFGVDDEDMPGDERLDLDQERARQAKEQADKLALENAALREEVAYVDDIAMMMGQALGSFRARLLAAASKLAPLVNPEDPDVARELIEVEHSEALAELAEFEPSTELPERPANGVRTVRDAKPPTKAD